MHNKKKKVKKENLKNIISVGLIIIFIIALLCILFVDKKFNKKSDNSENNPVVNSDECCEGCMCGDTIELLKTTETAWTLSEINNKGEYVYTRSFINFHGTGRYKFAFFKNDEDDNLISEVKGEFSINEKNDIILTPYDNKKNRITCKIGKEKDLIAVIHCDKDFGVFTLQKQGTLKLPNTIKDTIAKTKTIRVKGYESNSRIDKLYTEEKEINTLLEILNTSKVWTGAINLPGPQYEIELFDFNYNGIAKISYNPNNYFIIKIGNKEYALTNIDKELLSTILTK